MKLTHLDLFSGIGGFSLAADRVWGKDNITHIFCENDLFCQAVICKHWPEAQIYGDIRTLTYASEQRRQQKPRGTHGNEGADEGGSKNDYHEPTGSGEGNRYTLLTGGFPCQPFSQAGRRRGEDDDRFLWPEMLRVIREFSPLWVIAENVRGLLTIGGGVVFERVCTDLEAAGYEVQPLIIPAVAVGAPHRRDRVWFVAHRSSERRQQDPRGALSDESANEGRPAQNHNEFAGDNKGNRTATDTTYSRGRGGSADRRPIQRRQVLPAEQEDGSALRDKGEGRIEHSGAGDWNENWLEVATRLCTLDDGLPNGLVRPRGWRNAALKAGGNSIVPQVAEEIMRAIPL